MNELKLITEFYRRFNATEVDKNHMHKGKPLMGPFNPKVILIDGQRVGCIDLRKENGTIHGFVELAYIYMYDKQKGYGEIILKEICRLADLYNLEIILDAVPIEGFGEPIPIGKLHSFYTRKGFKYRVPNSNMMVRAPNA
ncbi:MAG: hypothetical protein AXW15_03445 [Neptuniibacter sp. Phe_28]|jgi:hypothetical protein|nr:MAG: hypothetical protein AXW15_03445 [Neptuniibacter sp. Phe_28]